MNHKTLKWIARILALTAIAFMVMFSADCFDGNDPIKNKLLCFFMHNIPALLLIITLVVAWNFEIIGGTIFILAFIAMAYFFGSFTGNPWSLVVISPFLIIGILFIMSKTIKNPGNNKC